VTQALALLRRLGAADDSGVTEQGQALARLPVHPRLGRLLVEGQRWGQPERAALAAALLGERSPFTRGVDRPSGGRRRAATPSDVLDAVEALEEFECSGRTESVCGELHRGAAHWILRARDQLVRSLREASLVPRPVGQGGNGDEALLRSLFAAFPDRLARRRN